VEAKPLAGVKKKAKNEGPTIFSIDESELSQRPHHGRTGAPRGRAPVLPYHLDAVAHADREVTREVEGLGYLGRPKNKT
jgi:hypothetical protein